MTSEIRIYGLTRFEAVSLSENVSGVRVEDVPNHSSLSHGEPILVSVILALGGVGAFALWLAKSRKRERIDFTFEVKMPDGTVCSRRFSYEFSESVTTEQSVKAFKAAMDASLKGLVDEG